MPFTKGSLCGKGLLLFSYIADCGKYDAKVHLGRNEMEGLGHIVIERKRWDTRPAIVSQPTCPAVLWTMAVLLHWGSGRFHAFTCREKSALIPLVRRPRIVTLGSERQTGGHVRVVLPRTRE